jgi:hypothetical protein
LEGGDTLAHGVVSEFADMEHVGCKFADFLGAELVRRVQVNCRMTF